MLFGSSGIVKIALLAEHFSRFSSESWLSLVTIKWDLFTEVTGIANAVENTAGTSSLGYGRVTLGLRSTLSQNQTLINQDTNSKKHKLNHHHD